MNDWAQFAATGGPLIVGVGTAFRAYAREIDKGWREQHPEDAAARDAKRAAKRNRNLSPQFEGTEPE